MIDSNILETPTAPLRKCIINKHYTRLKSSGILRLIWAGTRTNRCLRRPPPFAMHNVPRIIRDVVNYEHTHAGELDCEHSYYQIWIAKAFRRFLCISTCTHGVLQFTRPPMGMSWASFCLHKALTSAIAASPYPYTTPVYADNIYPLGSNYTTAAFRLDKVEQYLIENGWALNATKRREPFPAGDILGVHVDLLGRKTQPTAAHRTGLQRSAARMLRKPTRHHARQLLGDTIWAAQADPTYLQFTHHIVTHLRGVPEYKQAPVPTSPQLADELLSLAHHARTSPPAPMPNTAAPSPTHVIYTDASDALCAVTHVAEHAVADHVRRIRSYDPQKPSPEDYLRDVQNTIVFAAGESDHINESEAEALVAGLHYADENKLHDATFAVDSSALYYAVRKGRSNNPALHKAATYYNRLRVNGFRPNLSWTPSENNLADLPTRMPLGTLTNRSSH